MPIGQEKNVLSAAFHRKIRAVLHQFKIQRHKKIGTAQRAARVPALALMHHTDNVAPHLRRRLLQALYTCFHLFSLV
jgi:hypothetical protein